MSVQTAAIYLNALIEVEVYALLCLAWDRYSELCRTDSKRRRFWSNYIFNMHEYLGKKAYFGNPFVFIQGHRPTLID